MARATLVRVSAFILSLLFISCSIQFSTIAANGLSLVVDQSKSLRLTPNLLVEKYPGSKPGAKVLCERVHILGYSRLNNHEKFAHSVKVNVSYVISRNRPPNVEICFHRNASLGIGMCPQGQWEKLTKGSWAKSMSPFDHKLLDVRIMGYTSETLEVSLDEEFFLYRVIFLVLGNALMTTAWALSNSLVFYYSGAMAVGVILIILMVLFQGMKLLPTGRKNSLAIVLYSCMLGLGSFLLRYVPRLLTLIFVEMGIGEDLYNPLAIFFLLFLILAGAWLGFWVVRKLVLMEDGSIDVGISYFVGVSIWLFGAIMTFQSSVDPFMQSVNLISGILISLGLRRISQRRFMSHLYELVDILYNLFREAATCVGDFVCSKFRSKDKSKRKKSRNPDSSPIEGSYGEYDIQRPFYSTFHSTPERRRFARDEWDKFTRESTKSALEELVSSPDFSRWAVAHADRITLIPRKDTVKQPRRWLFWF